MEIFESIPEMHARARQLRQENRRIAFVPTMGALHQGHLALIEKAKETGGAVAVSNFLNSKQFNDPKDFENYPRDVDEDRETCREAGVELYFEPKEEDIYPPGFLTTVNVSYLSKKLEGEFRPGHFRGVCTVMLKLLNIVQPTHLVMGLKDAQQFTILQHMIADLNMDVTMVGVPTVREKDGLACSSRNALLTPEQREQALCMSRALKRVHFLVKKQGILHRGELMQAIRSAIATAGAELEYAAIVNRTTLEPLDHVIRGGTYVLLAAKFGDVRLIDNTRS